MIKTAVSPGRLAAMVLFALSCFGLLLFLWLSFGGSVPLQPKGYRFQVAFRDASQLGEQADVRISGVSVGKVIKDERDPQGGRTLATIELDPKLAPLPADTRAVLRLKTLLGETYVELTPGTPGAPKVPEGGRLPNSHVQGTVEFDEILNTFDPRTRRLFQTWQRDTGTALAGRGGDLNAAFGDLPEFVRSGDDLLSTLDTNRASVKRLVRNTAIVFAALTQRERQLHKLVTATDAVFGETARRDRDLSAIFAVLPTFLRESQRTFQRTQSFAVASRPVVQLLRPPTRDLGPTIRDVRALAPDLTRALLGIRRLEPVSRTGLPALGQTLRGLRPVLEQLNPFLGQLNPILQMLEQNQYTVADFLGGGALADTEPTQTPGSAGHYLRQFGVSGAESAGIYRERLSSNRGDAYPKGTELADLRGTRFSIGPQWDCLTAGFEGPPAEAGRDGASQSRLGCWVAPPSRFQGRTSTFPHVQAADYSKGAGVPGVAP